MIYTTGLYLHELDEEDRKLSRRMVERWIKFAYGFNPWKPRLPDGYDLTVMQDGLEDVTKYPASPYRRVEAQDLIAQDVDKYGEIFREFLDASA
jgi:hypothetical protein